MSERFIESSLQQEDFQFETSLRPRTLDEFIGQEGVKERLAIMIAAAKQRKDPLAHCLFGGPPGLGKTTLAHICAKTMGTQLVITSGPALERAGDLAGILTNLQAGDILFIDEIHRLNRTVEEYLYPAMEDYALDLMIDSGPNARSVQVTLNPFTLIGATTRVGQLSAPMRSRFGMTLRLDHYEAEPLTEIIVRSANILRLELDRFSATEVAKRARGTPRIGNNLLRWVRDYVQARKEGAISHLAVCEALELLAIDHLGLDEIDKRILQVIIENYQGGPVGLNTLAVAIGEESLTLEEVYEPFLIVKGLLKRTARGREATHLAYDHLGLNRPKLLGEDNASV